MSRSRRRVAGTAIAVVAAFGVAASASAHPLGNYTVNRGVEVMIASGRVEITYIVDMAEIPAFGEVQTIDANGDGTTDAAEQARYAARACAANLKALALEVDGAPARLSMATAPTLTFPAGAGGLQTLRLVCTFVTARSIGVGTHDLHIADRTDDGHVGWHEVVIGAGPGASLTSADVPAQSRSVDLTKYPVDALQTPPNVRSGSAAFGVSGIGQGGGGGSSSPVGPTRRATANDPLAALISGRNGVSGAVLAILLALGLGAAHAASPGHGKTLVAAYLIGSSGSAREAATLGLTVAATHTAGVFLLGAVTLVAGRYLLPEDVIAWLTLGSGLLVVLLGAGLVIRAAWPARGRHAHDHDHDHPHEHDHGHEHPHRSPSLRPRNVVALGLAGGMVPSSSALIVLLVAVTTNQLLFGMGLIVAFGIGMALVLGGLALATTLARSRLAVPGSLASHPRLRRAGALVPVVSGVAVLAAGLAMTIGAATRFV